jgi:hypothetical protein
MAWLKVSFPSSAGGGGDVFDCGRAFAADAAFIFVFVFVWVWVFVFAFGEGGLADFLAGVFAFAFVFILAFGFFIELPVNTGSSERGKYRRRACACQAGEKKIRRSIGCA